MARKLTYDRTLFYVTLALIGIGLVMVYSASAVIANSLFGKSYAILLKQAISAVLGLGLMLLVMRVDYRKWRNPSFVFPFLFLCLLLLVAVFFVDRSHNTHRWIKLGAFSFQPAELTKLVLIFFLTYFLEHRLRALNDVRRTLLPVAAVMLLVVALILKQPDFGTAATIALIGFAILFTAGLHWRYVFTALVATLPFFYLFIYRVRYRFDRIMAFVDPWSDPLGRGFQIIQSFIALGSGGVLGVGLVEGKQKLFYLPEPQNDFIFAVIGEELGFVGGLVILALFVVIAWRGLRAALASPDVGGLLMGVGLTMMIVFQAFINISVVTGLLPTKGIPLPFLSAGGSSLIVNCFAIGVLLNISQHAD